MIKKIINVTQGFARGPQTYQMEAPESPPYLRGRGSMKFPQALTAVRYSYALPPLPHWLPY